jgi:putative Holliday junction resolvase
VSGAPVSGTILGFDFGTRRIGVAVGETATGIATPLAAIAEESNAQRFRRIDALVDEWRPAAFVVGQPRHADGSAHAVAALAAKFARRLHARYRREVMLVDETLSSSAAESSLAQVRTRASRGGEVDALAATIILQSYLEEPHRHGRLAP